MNQNEIVLNSILKEIELVEEEIHEFGEALEYEVVATYGLPYRQHHTANIRQDDYDCLIQNRQKRLQQLRVKLQKENNK